MRVKNMGPRPIAEVAAEAMARIVASIDAYNAKNNLPPMRDECRSILENWSRDMKYRKKPVVVEAVRFWGDSFFPEWALRAITVTQDEHGDAICYVETLEGQMRCNRGDWLIRGVHGEVYPCKNDIFEKTYEAVEE